MKDFTSQQKEVVARKLGYDGPMQGFDEFLASSPALEAKYAAITGKFSQRMANGGLVKMKPRGYVVGGDVSRVYDGDYYYNQQLEERQSAGLTYALANGMSVATYYNNILEAFNNAVAAGLDNNAIRTEMDTYGISTGDLSRATGLDLTAVQNAYDAAVPNTTPPPTTPPPTTITTVTTTPAPPTTPPPTTTVTTTPAPTTITTTVTTTPAPTTTRTVITTTPIPVTTRTVVVTTPAPVTTVPGTTRAPGVTLSPAEAAAALTSRTAATQTGGGVTFSATGVPQAGDAAQVATISTIDSTEAQKIGTEERAGTVSTIEGTTPATATLATPPTSIKPETITAETALADLNTKLATFLPAVGTLSEAAKVKAAEDTTTALAGAADRAAQIATAQKVAVVPERMLGAAETVAGSAVDMTKVATELAKAEAATGTVTEDMTVQGQLAKLTKNFDATNPPSWAAGALRAVTAEMSARGLGSSSLAGAALIQAAMEKALPIASADAAIYQQFASQNLSNRQQIAVLTAQQRATFLGQEFDQNFQTRVVNAARVADIANLNFNAKQQVALENSRLAQSVDLANLNSRQAAFMAELAQTATLETASLNNRQQAAVVNAQSALQMDLINLSYEQQTTVLKAQLTAQAILSDTAAENAAKQFNASSTNQTNQFFATLSSQVSQFNSAQSNAMEQFKVDQANSVKKFNAEVQNQREQFNAQQRLVIDQSNAQWQREISTANTAATNLINLQNAQLSQAMTLTEYNNEIQMYRDAVTHAWQSAENDANRATTLAASEISAAAAIAGASIKADSDSSTALGSFVGRVLVGVATGGAIK